MKKRTLYATGLLTFLLALSTIYPVIANDWGSPLAMDPSSDGEYSGEDIQSVDARYANEFVFFRFKMNEYLPVSYYYAVYVDFDKNTSSGGNSSGNSDMGYEFDMYFGINQITPYIEASIYLSIYGGASYEVYYNMTANNGTAYDWTPDPSIDPYFDAVLLLNTSQGEAVYGVNWTWLCGVMALEGVEGDNCSMYLEFEVGGYSDWCPDRTTGATDYIEWDLCADTRGIPGFPMALALLSLLTFLGVTILLHRTRIEF